MKKLAFACMLFMSASAYALPPSVYLVWNGNVSRAKNECVLDKEAPFKANSSAQAFDARNEMTFKCAGFPGPSDTVRIVVDKGLSRIEVDTLYTDGSMNGMSCRGDALYNRVECRYTRVDDIGIIVRDRTVGQTGTVKDLYVGLRGIYKLRK